MFYIILNQESGILIMFRLIKMYHNFQEYQDSRYQNKIPAVYCMTTDKNPTTIKHTRYPILKISDTFRYENYREYTL